MKKILANLALTVTLVLGPADTTENATAKTLLGTLGACAASIAALYQRPPRHRRANRLE